MRKKLTTEEFIRRAREIHGDKYDYSKTVYTGSNKSVIIICPVHGEFKMLAENHLRGEGCKKCHYDSLRLNTEEFIRKARKIHGDKYDYSKTVYTGSNKSVIIICPVHGEFKIRASNHLRGIGCKNCSYDSLRSNTEEFIRKAREIHGDKYDYSKTVYTGHRNEVAIICSIHGKFTMPARSHLAGNDGCPHCNESKLETTISDQLVKSNISFQIQQTWPWLVHLSKLRVDFYLPDYNIVIECQGLQHFEPVNHFGGEERFKRNIENDKLKLKLCNEHGIKVVYFSNLSTSTKCYQYPYKVYEDVSQLFKEELNIEIN